MYYKTVLLLLAPFALAAPAPSAASGVPIQSKPFFPFLEICKLRGVSTLKLCCILFKLQFLTSFGPCSENQCAIF